METVIPILVLAFVVIHVIAYAFAIVIRRYVMLPLVEKFMEREDASILLKSIVVDAFHDAVSVKLPIKLLQGHLAMKRQKEVEQDMREPESDEAEQFDLVSHCSKPTPANEALNEILYTMFRINRKFNIVLFVICSLWRLDFKKVAVDIQQIQHESGSVYVDMKHQHQH